MNSKNLFANPRYKSSRFVEQWRTTHLKPRAYLANLLRWGLWGLARHSPLNINLISESSNIRHEDDDHESASTLRERTSPSVYLDIENMILFLAQFLRRDGSLRFQILENTKGLLILKIISRTVVRPCASRRLLKRSCDSLSPCLLKKSFCIYNFFSLNTTSIHITI